MDRLGIIDWLSEHLDDCGDASRVTYPVGDLVRTHLLLLGQGWRDQDDADRLREEPSLRVARSSRQEQTPLTQASTSPLATRSLVCSMTSTPSARVASVVGSAVLLRARQPGGDWERCSSMLGSFLERR